MNALLDTERKRYHKELIDSVLSIHNGIASNADVDHKSSKAISKIIADKLGAVDRPKLDGQTAGKEFERINTEFLESTFFRLNNINSGSWSIYRLGNKNKVGISDFEQYSHLLYLDRLSKSNPELAASLGNDYMVSPDIIISRNLLSDQELNKPTEIVNSKVATKADLRKENGGKPLLHASISSKWTIRSDRSQNSRTEALNLIRNRKGHLPHIVVVTAEPLPSRLASIALGTGDIDCIYHSFLYELVDAVKQLLKDDTLDLLNIMIEGKRLKDISDLPLDLAT